MNQAETRTANFACLLNCCLVLKEYNCVVYKQIYYSYLHVLEHYKSSPATLFLLLLYMLSFVLLPSLSIQFFFVIAQPLQQSKHAHEGPKYKGLHPASTLTTMQWLCHLQSLLLSLLFPQQTEEIHLL